MADFNKKLAKAIKAKGLQKLKFWCELCHKQCRDANGYKNHCTTEGHLRQVKLFAENSNAFLDEYSKNFENAFMELMRRRWRFKDILAKKAYNEYIQDKEHVHMNATHWESLSQFVEHLGKAGLCEVSQSDEGWVLRYIDRDPQREAKQAAMRAKEKEELEQKEIEKLKLLKQLKAFQSSESPEPTTEIPNPTEEEQPQQPSGPIAISLKPTTQATTVSTLSSSLAAPSNITSTLASDKKRSHPDDSHDANKRIKTLEQPSSSSSALDSLIADQERRREKEGRRDYWLHTGIVVKVRNKEVGNGRFYGLKGLITKVEDRYLATVKMLDSEHILKLDQKDLETVLPALKSQVLVVNGAYRGELATLLSLDTSKYMANISISNGPSRGRTLSKSYDDICKVVLDTV